jgi:hypothetical protein
MRIFLMSMGDLIAIAVIAVCAIWVGRMAWSKLRGTGGCGCDHCPTGKTPPAKP